MSKCLASVTLLGLALTSVGLARGSLEANASSDVPRYGVFELLLIAEGDYENPYLMMPGDDTSPGFVVGTFTGPAGQVIEVDGFWDGGQTWRVRMAPTDVGLWTYVTSSSDAGLGGVEGSLQCVPSNNHGFLRSHPDNPFAFAYDDGTPFFWMGDTQIIFYDHGRDDYRYDNGSFQDLQDLRVQQGMSSLCFGSWLWKKPGNFAENEGGFNFDDEDPDRLNPGFWQAADDRVQYVVNAGLVPGLGLGWPDQGVHEFGDDRLLRGIRYLVARYAAFNVTWTLFGEANEYGSGWADWTRLFGNALECFDPYGHIATTHHTNRTAPELGDDPWLDINVQQRGRGIPEDSWNKIVEDRAHGKPVCNVEFGYDYQYPPDDLRERAWMIIVHGGWFQWGEGFEPENEGRTQMQYLAEFYREKVTYWLLKPRNDLVVAGDVFCSALAAWDYVIYVPDGGDFSVDVSDAAGWVLHAEWLDPRGGSYLAEEIVPPGGTADFSPPLESVDWVLHLQGGPDLVRDGRVNFDDLLELLAAWGPNPDHRADFDGNGSVDFNDLLLLLSHWSK